MSESRDFATKREVGSRIHQQAEDWALDTRDFGYCDYCEQIGHTFNTCPKRDDEP